MGASQLAVKWYGTLVTVFQETCLHTTGQQTCTGCFTWLMIIVHSYLSLLSLTLHPMFFFRYSPPRIQRTYILDRTVHRHLVGRSQRTLRLQPGTATRTAKRGKLIRRHLEVAGTAKEETLGTSTATMAPTMPRTPSREPLDLVSCSQWYLSPAKQLGWVKAWWFISVLEFFLPYLLSWSCRYVLSICCSGTACLLWLEKHCVPMSVSISNLRRSVSLLWVLLVGVN